uniref:Uncharacterized protein n=1 Tax=Heterorhabditis bacteriophora TaxID=37862 RepID=A0A1I7XIT7_HETBA
MFKNILPIVRTLNIILEIRL